MELHTNNKIAESGVVGLAWQEFTKMSLRNSVVGCLGHMLCSCGSFLMIWQQSYTDLKKCLP